MLAAHADQGKLSHREIATTVTLHLPKLQFSSLTKQQVIADDDSILKISKLRQNYSRPPYHHGQAI
jgi:hypothetical protein